MGRDIGVNVNVYEFKSSHVLEKKNVIIIGKMKKIGSGQDSAQFSLRKMVKTKNDLAIYNYTSSKQTSSFCCNISSQFRNKSLRIKIALFVGKRFNI